jgi:hypothetical protein
MNFPQQHRMMGFEGTISPASLRCSIGSQAGATPGLSQSSFGIARPTGLSPVHDGSPSDLGAGGRALARPGGRDSRRGVDVPGNTYPEANPTQAR